MSLTPLLEVEDVKAYYIQRIGKITRVVKAVDGVSLRIHEREIIGVIGESGCGKSTLSNVLMLNIQPPLKLLEGSVKLYTAQGIIHMEKLSKNKLRDKIWGKEIAVIPQSALNALMPTLKIKRIAYDILKSHISDIDMKKVEEIIKERFRALGLSESAVNMYPFELSGGMRQRAVIAISTLLNPRLLIADEPTSALDVVTQKSVMKTLKSIFDKEMIKSMVFISHDIATVRQIAMRMIVMYAGKIVEDSPTEDLISRPLHPYTEGLIGSVLTPEEEVKKRGLRYIPGQPPDLSAPPPGCRFQSRCPYVMDICKKEEPPLKQITRDRFVACWLYIER